MAPKKIVIHIGFVSSVGIRLFDIDFGLFEFILVLGFIESFLNFIFVFVFVFLIVLFLEIYWLDITNYFFIVFV